MLIIVRRGGSYMSEELEEVEGPADSGAADTGSAALSLALGRTGKSDKALDEDARAFLKKQGRLIDLQTEHLHEQREIVLSRLRWGRFSDRMKALLQVMTACIGLAIAGGIGWMAWSASQDRGLVIEPFSVPPDLAQKGLTGQVVASMLLDKLGEMQNATVSARAPSTYANNWNDQIKVEIPETGVSVGELQRLLVQWLGHQTSISGELYRTPTGLALAARTGTAPAKEHTGQEADLDAMVQAAAEDVYATTQPYRYAVWLQRSPDPAAVARARQAMEQLATVGDGLDRMWAYNGLSVNLTVGGDFQGAYRAASEAIALDPRFTLAYANRGDVDSRLGHAEAQLADYRQAQATAQANGRRFLTTQSAKAAASDGKALVENTLGDYAAAARDRAAVVALHPADMDMHTDLVNELALDHDIDAARLAGSALPTPPAADQTMLANFARARLALVAAQIALPREDWRGFADAAQAIDKTSLPTGTRLGLLATATPFEALADAELGDIGKARALIATTPLDCYACLRMRGRIAAVERDWPAAERWFAAAARLGPSLPFAEADWGRALLEKGDPAGAIARLRIAHQRSPDFADPLETWGEALMAQRDYAGAAGKFAEADKAAPKWGRNHLRRGEALMLAGRYHDARAQFEAADGLDLSPADRAALNVLLNRTARGPLHG